MTFLGCKKLGSLQRWWEGTLLSHQPDKVAIPIDNFVYHFRLTAASKRPTIPWRKAEIQMWLVRKGIIFSAEDKKRALLQTSKELFIATVFQVEEITEKLLCPFWKKIEGLCLPFGHSELKPTELIWVVSNPSDERIRGFATANPYVHESNLIRREWTTMQVSLSTKSWEMADLIKSEAAWKNNTLKIFTDRRCTGK